VQQGRGGGIQFDLVDNFADGSLLTAARSGYQPNKS